jgi:hypothetical protein
MEPDELALWLEGAAAYTAGNGRGTKTPCTDCPMWYHLQEKAAGRCDRKPQPHGGVPGRPGRKAQWREAQARRRAGTRSQLGLFG